MVYAPEVKATGLPPGTCPNIPPQQEMKRTLSLLALAMCLPMVHAQSSRNVQERASTSTVTTYNVGDQPPEIGVGYCENAAGFLNTGNIHAYGSTVASDNMVLLTAGGLPPNSIGYFIVGETRDLVHNPGGSQGDLCVGGKIGRFHGPGQVLNSGPGGYYELWLNLTEFPMNPNQMVIAGETWCFQSWYRMPVAPVQNNSDSDFTSAVEILFQ